MGLDVRAELNTSLLRTLTHSSTVLLYNSAIYEKRGRSNRRERFTFEPLEYFIFRWNLQEVDWCVTWKRKDMSGCHTGSGGRMGGQVINTDHPGPLVRLLSSFEMAPSASE